MKKLTMAAVVAVSIVCFTGMAFAQNPIWVYSLPYNITQPGSYQLISNITVPNANTTAILVQTDNVTIDMNGYAILGPNNCTGSGGSLVCDHNGSGIGIDAGYHINIKVYNGTVRGMGKDGISVQEGVIEGMRVQSNGRIGIFINKTGTVSGNTVIGNGGSGISLDSDGTASGNTVKGNAQEGIFVSDGTVSGNTVNDNGGSGISLNNGTVSGNTANGNGGSGILVNDFGTVSGNTARSNHGYGILVGGSGTVSNNTANKNNLSGILVEKGTVSSNTADENSGNGFQVGSGTVNGNTARGNTGDGMSLGAVGYVNNVLDTVNPVGGVNLKPNLCNLALCP